MWNLGKEVFGMTFQNNPKNQDICVSCDCSPKNTQCHSFGKYHFLLATASFRLSTANNVKSYSLLTSSENPLLTSYLSPAIASFLSPVSVIHVCVRAKLLQVCLTL